MQSNSFMAATLLLAALLLLPATTVLAWGPEGHRVVGLLAERLFADEARTRLMEILGSGDRMVMAETCNWPDTYRDTDEGAWSAPQHYINVPRGAHDYDAERDCPGGACSAGAIGKYAVELGDESLPAERRRQAWSWVCHLAGDIHQPMHSGYGDDRGGNDFHVVFKGEAMNLHAFWDHALIGHNYPDWELLTHDLAHDLPFAGETGWSPEDVDAWVQETHDRLEQWGYPQSPRIEPEFAAASWLLARDQIVLAAARLAALVNQVLGKAEGDAGERKGSG